MMRRRPAPKFSSAGRPGHMNREHGLSPRQEQDNPRRSTGLWLSFLIGPSVIAAWVALSALAYIVFEPSETVLVIGPQQRGFHAVVAADARVLSGNGPILVVRGEEPGFVRRLYAGGAWLVLPTTEVMCGQHGVVRTIIAGR